MPIMVTGGRDDGEAGPTFLFSFGMDATAQFYNVSASLSRK